MIAALRRKVAQLAADPALRRFLVERALGRICSPPPFIPGRPPYLDAGDFHLGAPPARGLWREQAATRVEGEVVLPLPGADITVTQAHAVFDHSPADLETHLGLHRFCWLPVLGDAAPPGWVAALWQAWMDRFGQPDSSWAWHPYTAAERAINILDHARRHGLPGPSDRSLAVLAAHVPVIADRLEYGGEYYTGNHLSNNGRGLFILGLGLGWPRAADIGARILRAEAERLFAPSGILREGSSHYHLLVARNYLSCWLAARRHGRDEADMLAQTARRALAVVPSLTLPGGMPLVGDISPDCPPDFLAGLLPGGDLARGWGALLDVDERMAVGALRDQAGPVDRALLAVDGWLRADHDEWAVLWHAAAQGWPHMPGHGHHDLGGFELHWRGQQLFIDPGRGTYGESGEAALYRSAAVHSTLQLDGADPTPANRPYYDDAFRRRIGGEPPVLDAVEDGVRLVHHGFGARIERLMRFKGSTMSLTDRVEGGQMRRILRRLVTPWEVSANGNCAKIITPAGSVVVAADAPVRLVPITRWSAYGVGHPATAIEIECRADSPHWRGTLSTKE